MSNRFSESRLVLGENERHFTERYFTERHFTERHFTERYFTERYFKAVSGHTRLRAFRPRQLDQQNQ